jgi:predicted small secreted protein
VLFIVPSLKRGGIFICRGLSALFFERIFMRNLTVGLLVLASASLLSACAGNTIRDVPKIDSEKIQVPAMSALPKRDMALTIVDNRNAEMKNESLELQAELERAVSRALTRTGIAVTANSANALTITVQDYATEKFQEGCVKINGSLLIPKKAKLASDATSCYQMNAPGGRMMSADVKTAYEEALSLVFKNLDQALGKLQTM